MKKQRNAWLLIALPVLLFLIGILYLRSSGIYFLKSVDPEYAYLFNGALFADLKFKIYYILHPGTPLIILIAAVIRIVHAFRPAEDMLTDVIRNPELYIKAIIYTINLLNAGMLLLLGVFTFRKTRNIWLAVFIQLIPFVQSLALETLARVIPEALMLPLICLWIMEIIVMLSDEERIQNIKRHSLVLGMLYGLSVALKLTLLPFAVVPLIILSGWKSRLKFAVVSVISFSVFAFPVLRKYKLFYSWVKNIITHTGAYGKGDHGILHWNEFFGHLKFLVDKSPYLIISLIVLIVSLIIYRIAGNAGIRRDKLKLRLSVSIVVVIILQYLITAKHFAFHYMMPAILLTVPMIILSASMLHETSPSLLTFPRLKAATIILGILMLGYIIPHSYSQITLRKARNKTIEESYIRYKENRSDGPLIVSASYNGCAAVEYALTFAIQESGKYYNHYLYEKVKSIYPSTYLYYPWGKVFYAGHDEIAPSSFLKENTNYMLYIAEFSNEKLDEITGYLNQNDKGLHFFARNIYYLQATNEALYQLVAQKDVTNNQK